MELAYLALGAAVLLSALCGVAAVGELVTTASVKPAPKRAFALLRAGENQFKTVIAPALAALISGCLVSISASYFFKVSQGQGDDIDQLTGTIFFVVAGLALVITLRIVLGRNREVLEFIRTPAQIRSAADAVCENPQAPPLEVDVLRARLVTWEESIAARSLEVRRDVSAVSLHRALRASRNARSFPSCVRASLRIQISAVRRFPLSFGVPLLVVPLYLVGLLVTITPELTFSLRSVLATLVMMLIGVLPVACYYAARGNRARRTFQITLLEIARARRALLRAEAARREFLKNEESRERLLRRVEEFLDRSASVEAPAASLTREPAGRGAPARVMTLGRWTFEIHRRRAKT